MIGVSLVKAYLTILEQCKRDRNMAYHLDELLRIGSCGVEKKPLVGGPPMSSKPDFIRKSIRTCDRQNPLPHVVEAHSRHRPNPGMG
jgi:hypothetical protein